MKRTIVLAATLAACLSFIAPPAGAQMETREAIALQDQILELRHELQMLQSRGVGAVPQPYYAQPAYPGAPPAGGSDIAAQLVTRVGALEEQMRQLRGRVDNLENEVQRGSADLSKQIEDLKFQMQNGGGATATAAPPAPPPFSPPPSLGTVPGSPPTPPPATAAPPGPRTPETALQEGYAALARRDYAASEKIAQEVLSRRTSPRAYDAQFLLAQSLAGERQWSRAAIAYDDAYNRSPKGSHADESLLGLANSLTAINEKRAACETLTKLRTEFPRGKPELKDQIAATSQRAGCK